MLCSHVLAAGYPTLDLHESTVEDVLALQEEKNILSFPVLDNEELIGILSVKDVLHLPESTIINSLQHLYFKSVVSENDFFYTALRVMNITDNIVPVTDIYNKYRGTISQQSLLQALHTFLDISTGNDGIIVMEINKINYSFFEIARLVESCKANILQLNTYFDTQNELFIITIKVNRSNISEIVSTLQRHDYLITYYFGEEKFENEIKRNYDELMNYLNI